MAVIRKTPWRQCRWAAAVIATLFVSYLGTYAIFYRRGVAEAEQYGLDYFVYVPMADVIAAKAMTRPHELLGPIFDPVNHLHRQWFGGRAACRCIMFGLSRS